MPNTWTVPAHEGRLRLDQFLASMMPEISRSQIAKQLKQGAGRINGKHASVHTFVHEGAEVLFEQTAATVTAPVADLPPLTIIEETPEVLVINKPSGLIVHPDKLVRSGTLVDLLLAHAPSIARIGEDPERPGIMHRLDKDASGLMVIAKTQEAFEILKKQFATHQVQKTYTALVYGEVAQDAGDIRFKIARSKTRGRMAARPEKDSEGKAAWTHYRVLTRYRNATLLELDIFSGRTHQIRAHLFALNHPIIGDPLYTRRIAERNIRAPRLLLEATSLTFEDPVTHETRSYTLPLDPVFRETIAQL